MLFSRGWLKKKKKEMARGIPWRAARGAYLR